MAKPALSRQFARWAAELTFQDLTPKVVDKVKALLLHALTGGVLGAGKHQAVDAVQFTLKEEGKPDGASLIWHDGRATRVGAAYANSEMMHVSGLFDSYRMLTHPGPVLVPAALANAELEGRSGRDLIVALAAGYEFELRLCDEFIPSTAARGFRPSPIYSTMGAALASGKLLGLNEDGLTATIALASNFASGLNEGPRVGANDNSIHEPQASRNGVFAALIAREGHIKGAESSLDGEAGFYTAFTGNNQGRLSYSFTGRQHHDPAEVTRDLGREWKLLTAMFRMYPVSGYNQPVIDLIAEMRQQHGLTAEQIDNLAVRMNWIETVYPSPEFPREPDWNKPRVGSTHYYAAHAAVNGGYPVAGGSTFGPTGDDLKADQAVLDFMMKHVDLVQEKDRGMFSPGAIITLKDGRKLTGEYPYQRMEWNFDELVVQLQRCLPRYPRGKAGLDELVAVAREADRLDSMQAIHEAVRRP
jgi:2-methylcitrate dehydratase PrpD